MTQSRYRSEADALDREIVSAIEKRAVCDFNQLALEVFAHQLRYNEPYARYCTYKGVTLENMPQSWEAIPAVPTAAYKETALCTFDASHAKLTFETSGTTGAHALGKISHGCHYMENSTLYDAALLAGFRDAMLADAPRPLRYFMLVPDPARVPHSSLGYMMGRVASVYGDGNEGWYLQGESINIRAFIDDVTAAAEQGIPVCIAGTAFAFVHVLDALRDNAHNLPTLPRLSRIMETGGFKGRTRTVKPEELYAALERVFAVPQKRIVSEYGMTELSSQYYDDVGAATDPCIRTKRAGPWLRSRVVGTDGNTLPAGVVGILVHVDLANRSSCLAIQTEDLGVATQDGGIILLGREQGAPLRGCSLDAEQLRALQRV
jgi:Acyl-protein synthetase, LuxE